MNWIRELKFGDEFLDFSGKFIGKVISNDGVYLNFSWYKINNLSDPFAYNVCIVIESAKYAGWMQITPLIKELM